MSLALSIARMWELATRIRGHRLATCAVMISSVITVLTTSIDEKTLERQGDCVTTYRKHIAFTLDDAQFCMHTARRLASANDGQF